MTDRSAAHRWLGLAALSMPVLVLSVDMNGVVVLLPQIGHDLGGNAATAGAIETTPGGELDVFAFNAASMRDHRGIVLLAVTLGLFQNGSIKHVEMKRIGNAREDTLSDPDAIERWVDAFRRGAQCPVDVMGMIDLFAHNDVPLAEVRETFGVVPK